MAGVRINSGPSLDTPLSELDTKVARIHAIARAGDAIHALRDDCRPLAQLMDEAEAAAWIGEADRDSFIVNVLKWPVQTVNHALEGLRWFDLTVPVSLEAAAARGAEIAEIMARTPAAKTMAEAGALGGRGNKAVYNDKQLSKGGTRPSYLASRIKRDAPEIAAAVERGEYTSMRSAAIAAGIVKPPTALAALKAAWKKATDDERKAFLSEIVSD